LAIKIPSRSQLAKRMVSIMGLLGFFFNKRFLKLIFIFTSIFIFVEFLTLSISFVSGLNWFLQAILASFTLLVLILFASRFDRFRPLSGLIKFSCFTLVPLILVFNLILPLSIPFPLSIPTKLGTLVLPFSFYLAYRRKLWLWKSLSANTISRRYGKLSKDTLLPKALEEGHILYGAGVRGFKVIRFIEVKKDQQPDSVNEHNSNEHQILATSAASSGRLTMMKRYRMEMSYELYLQNGSLQCFIGLTTEGRNYDKIRTKIDQFTTELVSSPRSTDVTASATMCPVKDNNQAGRILMMPLSTTFDDLEQIQNDEYNARISNHSNSEKPIKLRSIHLVGLSTIAHGNDFSLADEFARVVLSHRPTRNIAYILHIRPLSARDIEQELAKTGNAYKEAMAHFVEGIRNGLLNGKSRSITRLFDRENNASDPRIIIEEAKTKFRYLKAAQESGYFEVGLTIVGEPASVESIARALKKKLLNNDPCARLYLVRSLPAVIRGVVRRDLTLPLGRFSGDELCLLMASTYEPGESETSRSDTRPVEFSCPLLAEKAAESKRQEALTK
jgi:hypothetical protein